MCTRSRVSKISCKIFIVNIHDDIKTNHPREKRECTYSLPQAKHTENNKLFEMSKIIA